MCVKNKYGSNGMVACYKANSVQMFAEYWTCVNDGDKKTNVNKMGIWKRFAMWMFMVAFC